MNSSSRKKVVVHAGEYAQGIPLLLSEQPNGRVHSVFQNGVNIQMGSRLFFIGTTKNGQLPFGIHVSGVTLHELLETVKENCSVIWRPNTQEIVFNETLYIVSLAQGTPFSWQLYNSQVSVRDLMDNLVMLVAILHEKSYETGLDICIEEFLASYLENEVPINRTDLQIRELVKAVNSTDEKKIEELVRFFLGRGKGLTPSGDDHLVGLLAIDAATDILSVEMRTILERLIMDERLTTDIGREYLVYALKGQFSSTVVQVTSALTRKADIYMLKSLLSELLDMGHSSGVDTVFGMLLGLLALRRRQEWQKK